MRIEFITKKQWVKYATPPTPASHNMPDWWRGMPQQQGPTDGLREQASTIKRCVPFLDTLRTGYILPMQYDLLIGVNNQNGEAIVQWREGEWLIPRVEERNWNGFVNMETGKGLPGIEDVPNPHGFIMMNPWVVKTPPGYSCLFTSVLNSNSPLQFHSGIVNTDTYNDTVNFPFFIKNRYVGTLKKGTPIMQIIPFKRDEWEMEVRHEPTEEDMRNMEKVSSDITGMFHFGYRDNHGCPVKHT